MKRLSKLAGSTLLLCVALASCDREPTVSEDERVAQVAMTRFVNDPELRNVRRAPNEPKSDRSIGHIICGEWNDNGTWRPFMLNSELRKVFTTRDVEDESPATTLKLLRQICEA